MLTRQATKHKLTQRPRIVHDAMSGVDGSSAIDLDPSKTEGNLGAHQPKTNLFYGWVMLLLAMGLAIASSPGQTFGVSIFIEPMRLELGLTHGQMGLAYTLGTLFGAGPILWIGQPLWARYYGTKHLGKLRGVLMATMVATSSIGPFLVGTCFDSYGSFLPVLGLFAMVPILFAAVSLFVNPPLSTNIKLESH